MKTNIAVYAYVINKNNSFILDREEMKDLVQDIKVYLLSRDYNDLITKKTILKHYLQAVTKKTRQQELIDTGAYLQNFDDTEAMLRDERMDKLKKLPLNRKQLKIVEMLVNGHKFEDIRKAFKINERELANKAYTIKKRVTGKNSGS